MKSLHLVIHGRVQGVGFRMFLAREAEGRGLDGWVRNQRDGTVEAVVAGDEGAVDAVIEACREGPPAASVSDVDLAPWPEPVRAGFRIEKSV